jgi:hypothetical protein
VPLQLLIAYRCSIPMASWGLFNYSQETNEKWSRNTHPLDRKHMLEPSAIALSDRAAGEAVAVVGAAGISATVCHNMTRDEAPLDMCLPRLLIMLLVSCSNSVQNRAQGPLVSCCDHRGEKIDGSSLVTYGTTKLMNVMVARELQRRMGDAGVLNYVVHPGKNCIPDVPQSCSRPLGSLPVHSCPSGHGGNFHVSVFLCSCEMSLCGMCARPWGVPFTLFRPPVGLPAMSFMAHFMCGCSSLCELYTCCKTVLTHYTLMSFQLFLLFIGGVLSFGSL